MGLLVPAYGIQSWCKNYFEGFIWIYGHWNGDVWKAIVEARTMTDIDTYTCKADHGLGLIFKRPNRNILQLDDKNFKKLKFKDYYVNHKKFMNLVEASTINEILN